MASSAAARLVATTAAAALHPASSTRSTAIACCGADFNPFRCESTPTQGVMTASSSGPVTMEMTPGRYAARRRRSPRSRRGHAAIARTTTCAIRGNSEITDVLPASPQQPVEGSAAAPSCRCRNSDGRAPKVSALVHRLRSCSAAPHARAWLSPRQRPQWPDSRCSGNSCRTGAPGSLDGRGSGTRLSKSCAVISIAGGTVAAPQCVAFAKCRLKIGDLAAVGQPLDRLNRRALRLDR